MKYRTRRLSRRLIAMSSFLVCIATGKADYFNFEQWKALSPDLQAVYIAAVADALVNYDDPMSPTAARRVFWYDGCIRKVHMTSGQLADDVRNFATTRAYLPETSVRSVLVQYLTSACGPPPS
jgi:hypothetical protein